MTTTSLPALHAYLAGRVSYRRGAYHEAVAHYERALKEDSTFALAALGRVDALIWVQSDRFPSAISHAWAMRNRLSERDLQWLYAYTGRDFSSGFTYRDQLRELEALLTVAADRPEAWYRWADGSLHWGRRTDYANWLESATQGFNRALALDSSFAAPLEHLIETAILRGDTAATRKLTADYIARHPSSELNDFLRWRVGVVTGDSAAVRAARSRYPDHELSRERIAGAALFTGQSVEDAEIASRIGTPNPEGLRARLLTRLDVGMALGRTSILREVTNRSFQMPLDASIDEHILDALVHSGFEDDSAFTALEQRLKNLPPLESLPVSALPYVWYYLGEWQYLHKGNVADLRKGVAALRSSPLDTVRMAKHVAIVLDALLAVAENRSDRREVVHRADSLSKEWPAELPETMNLLIARALEAVGEPKAALAAVRRRNNNYVAGLSGFATALREEGRLAELTGDHDAAIRAYRHYLQIRYSADGPFRKEVDEVRLALNRLVAEPK